MRETCRALLFASFILCGGLGVAAPDLSRRGQLLNVGDFYAADADPKSGETWYALASDSADYALHVGRISVDSKIVPGLTSRTNAVRQLKVEIDTPGKALILVRGIPGLREGHLRTDAGAYTVVRPGTTRALGNYGDERIWLEASSRPFNKGKGFGRGWTRYSLKMKSSSGKPPQQIAQIECYPGGPNPSVMWAGDLDRDGAPDLLMDLNVGETGASDLALFLSSAARGTERLRCVAKLHKLGC